MPGLPQVAFLLSIVGLSVSLAGFSGLVAAIRRGAPYHPIDGYRLRQIPEMALPAGFLALATLALADTTGSASRTIQVGGGAAVLFVLANTLVLIERARSMGVTISLIDGGAAAVLNLAVISFGVAALISPTTAVYEWVLTLLIARPGAAFLLALSDVTAT